MAQQHDVPRAFMRMWWRIPAWSRMVAAVGGGGALLVPLALLSISMVPPMHDALDTAAPGTPSTTDEVYSDRSEAMAVESPDATGTPATGKILARSLPLARKVTAGVAQAQGLPEALAQPQQPAQPPQVRPEPRSNDAGGTVQMGSPCDDDGGADQSVTDLTGVDVPQADLNAVEVPRLEDLTSVNLPRADLTEVIDHFAGN